MALGNWPSEQSLLQWCLRLGKQVEGEVEANNWELWELRDGAAFPLGLYLLRIKADSELAQFLSSLKMISKTRSTALCVSLGWFAPEEFILLYFSIGDRY